MNSPLEEQNLLNSASTWGSPSNEQAPQQSGMISSFERWGSGAPAAQVDVAHNQKVAALDEAIARRQATTEQRSRSFAVLSGAEEGSLRYRAENLIGQVVNMGEKLVTGALTAPMDAFALNRMSMVPDEAREAYGRKRAGTATPEDLELLASVNKEGVSDLTEHGATPEQAELLNSLTFGRSNFTSNETRINQSRMAMAASELVEKVLDTDHLVDQGYTEEMMGELRQRSAPGMANLKETWDNIKDGEVKENILDLSMEIADLLGEGMGTLASNPQATAELVAQMIPQIYAATKGKAVLGTAHTGMALELLRDEMVAYDVEHQGVMPQEELEDRTLAALAHAAISFVGDAGVAKGVTRMVGGREAGEGVGRTLGRNAGIAAASTAGESTAEGIQGGLEQIIQGKDVTPEAVYENFILGLGSTAPITAAGSIGAFKGDREQNVRDTDVKTFTDATNANDTSAYTDTSSEAYSPSRAMGVLFGNANLDSTTPEQKRANRNQASEVIQQATQQRDAASADWMAVNPEARKQQQATIAQLEAQLATAAPEEAAQIQGDLELFKSMLAEGDALSGKEIRARKRAFETAERELATAMQIKENLDKDVPFSTEEVDSILANVNQPVDEASGQQSAESVINLAMEQPDLLTPEQITSIVDNPTSSLTTIQRDYLRAFSASKDAENQLKSMGEVTKGVMEGTDGYKGLPEYRASISKAVRYGSTQRAQTEIDQLQSFGSSHEQKAALASQANEQALATGQPVQVVRTKEGQWELTQGVENYRDGGGLQFDGDDKGTRLAQAIATESTAINTVLAEATTMMALGTAAPVTAQPAAPVTETITPEPVVTEEVANVEVPTTAPVTDTDVSGPAEVAPVEPTTPATPETTAEAVPETGELSVFKQRNNATLQQSNNPVTQYFKQTGTQAKGTGRQPLVAQKDFISKVMQSPKTVREFVKGDITAQQSNALKSFLGNTNKWGAVVKRSLPKKGAEQFIYKDPVQGFANEDGSYDENFVAAITAAAFTWAAETGTGAQYNTPEAINAILGRPRSNQVSSEETDAFTTIGVRRNQVINSLGRRATQALGLKANAAAPADQISRLESSLGAHVYNLLKKEGIIVENVMSSEEMGAFRQTTDKKATHVFARMAGSTGLEPVNPKAEAIIEATRQSDSVINRLFGIDAEGIAPSFEPIAFNQETAQNSRMGIPGVQAKALKTHSKKAYRFRTGDMAKLMDVMPRQALAAIAGYVDTGSAYVHPNNAKSVEAKNRGIERELDAYYDFLAMTERQEQGRNQPFYIGHRVWLQQRVGMASRMVNLQTSKIHRHLVQMDGWEQKDVAIDPTDERFIQFRLGVADALGVKTDGMSRDAALARLDEKLASPLLNQGIISLRKILNDLPLEDREVELLVDAVAEGGEKYHTLDGLMAQAQYMEALEAGESTFTHNLTREIDGKTNGPMFTQILTGAADSVAALQTMVEKGGFFSREDGPTQVNAWAAEKGNNDLYQSVAKVVADTARGDYANNKAQFDALFKITDPLTEKGEVTKAGRNATKTPVTQVNFGSSVKNTIDSMGAEFAESMVAKVEKVVNAHQEKGTDATQELNEIADAVHTLTGIKLTANQLTGKLSNNVGRQLQRAYVDLLGDAITAGIDSHYSTFLSTRNQINTAGRLGFGLYNALRKVRHAQLVDGQVEKDKKGNPKHDLTGEQSKRLNDSLKNVEPMVHTAMSKLSGDIRAGFSLIQSDQGLSDADYYRSEVHFGADGFANSDGKTTKTTKVSGNARSLTDRGVGTLVLLAHAFDSAVSTLSYADQTALNVHDANIVAADMTQAQARRLNENTLNLLRDYSIPTEIAESLSRTVDGFLVELKKDPTNAALRKEYAALVKEAGKDMKKPDFLIADALGLDAVGYQLLQMKRTARDADITKLEAMRQWVAVDQYSMDGGNYVLTDKDYATIDEALEARRLDKPSQQMEAAKEINAILKQRNNAAPEAATKADVMTWGKKGTPAQANDAGLTDFLARRGTTSAKAVMGYLAKNLEQGDTFQRTLLNQLAKQVGDVAVVFVTPDMPVPDGTKERAAGWFHQDKDGKQTIFVRSPDFAASRIDPELMLHELVHAATANTMAKARTSQAKGDVADLIADLDDLRTNVAEHIAEDSERTRQFAPALESAEEMVAWGMTNEGFQQVLKEVQVAPRKTPNALVDGMRALIKSLVGLVFGANTSRQEVMESGLTRLISNSAGLMAADTQANGEINLAQENVDPVDEVMSWTTDQVFDALAKPTDGTSAAHRQHLHDLLGSMVNRLHGPFGAFKTEALKSQALTPDQVYIKALTENRTPFASDTLAAGFTLSHQEAFVLEQVEASVAASLDSSKVAYKELAKIYQQARVALRNDPALTADQYAYLFTMTNGADGKSAHLSRFAALALAHGPLNEAMKAMAPEDTSVAENASLAARIQDWFNRLLAYINARITGTYNGQPANTKIQTLADNLVHIEAKRRLRLANERSNPFDFIETGLRKAADKGREGLAKVGESKLFSESGNGYVRATGKGLSTIARDRVNEVIENAQILRDRHFKKRQGMVAAIISEMTGADDKTKTLYMLNRMTKNIERVRIEQSTQVGAQVIGSFDAKGTTLVKKAKDTLTKSLLHTDAAALVDTHSMADIHKMLTDKAFLNKERAKLENAVAALPMGKLYVRQADDLGKFMVTGKTSNEMLQLNAHNIAHLYGFAEAKQVEVGPETVSLIDQLVTLNALSHADHKDIQRVVAKEALRGEESGIEFTLRMAKYQKEQSLEKLFKGSPILMNKGHTKEITDPYKTVVAAPSSQYDAMKKKGYSASEEMLQDPTDPGETMRLYVIDDGGLKRYLSGAMSLTGERAKGTTLHGGLVPQGSSQVALDRVQMTDAMTRKKRALLKGNKHQMGQMIPVFNENGDVVNYRYMMNHDTRDTLLGRNNALDAVMGGLEGELLDKVASPEHNRKVVEALHDLYKADYAVRPDSYLTISATSRDPALREIYRMLPRETKSAVSEVWGRNELLVRADVLDLMFGYRKTSAADPFDKAREERSAIENAWVASLEAIFKDQSAIKVRKGEDIIQTIVKHVKDIVVVKNVTTLLGNIASNTTQLLWHGVNPRAIAGEHKVAMESAISYRRDKRELDELQKRQAMGYTTAGEITIAQRIPELQDALARNPSTPLIESGMMPTIVEDIDLIQDPYSYQSKTANKLEKWVNKVPKSVREVGKQVYMTHDTTAYKILAQGTQLSDYVARYTLYQHVRNRDTQPLSHEEALAHVMEAFINYDVPTHRNLQYMNDMGFVYFTKYYLRIQRVILSLYRDQPARALAMVMFNGFFNNVPTIMDSQAAEQAGNPLADSALRYPDVLDQLATVRAASSVFQ